MRPCARGHGYRWARCPIPRCGSSRPLEVTSPSRRDPAADLAEPLTEQLGRPIAHILQLRVQLTFPLFADLGHPALQGTVHGFDHVQQSHALGRSGQWVAAVGPVEGEQDARGDERPEHLEQESLRDALGAGNDVRSHGATRLAGHVTKGSHSVGRCARESHEVGSPLWASSAPAGIPPPAAGTPRGPGPWAEASARTAPAPSLRSELPELVIDEGEQLRGRVRVALTQGAQELRHVVVHQPPMIPGPRRARQQMVGTRCYARTLLASAVDALGPSVASQLRRYDR